MNIILLGPPGGGKGTQAELLKDRYGLMHLSSGDMIRREIQEKTELGTQARECVDSGKLLPDELFIKMISDTLDRPEYKVGVILDGFPRTQAQAEALEEMLAKKKQRIDHVIELAVDESLLMRRITGRFSCADCGAGYNDFFKKQQEEGICDICGSTNFRRREDDTVDTVKERFKVYRDQTMPIIPYYEEKGILEVLDGAAKVDEVAHAINNIIEKRK
jgi:adenylate kinase